MSVSALILAAGFSTRMGAGYKPLLPIPPSCEVASFSRCRAQSPEGNALTFLARLYVEIGADPIIVVSGQRQGEAVAEEAARLGCAHVRNPDAGCGMFSSVCVGLAAVAGSVNGSGVTHCFLHPADIPLVRPCTLLLLLAEARTYPNDILLPVFRGEEGHPPLLPVSYIPTILAWRGENGLRGALGNLPCRRVPVPDSNVLLDMDTDAEYAEVCIRAERRHLLEPGEAEELLHCREVPAKGLAHARAVGRVAAGFAQTCKDAGLYDLDPCLAEAGGLLHDLCKGEKDHERAAGRELRALGLPDMAALVEEHRDCPLADDAPFTEKELVYLADKYMRGGRLVTVSERFAQKMALYAGDPEALAAIAGRCFRAESMERRLGREVGVAPYEIARRTLEQS